MAPSTHEIDPDADTIITLKNASVSFAPWKKESTGPLTASDLRCDEVLDAKIEKAEGGWDVSRSKADGKKWPLLDEYATDDADAPSREDITANAIPAHGCSTSDAEPDNEEDIHYRVSSRHLMLASPWFKRLLKKERWSESARNERDGFFHITAAEWDAEAFLILLNIFHIRNRKVPRTVSLEMLAKIAVLADYYECHEVLELFTTMWLECLKKSSPIRQVYDRYLVLWICISWVFDVKDFFAQATAIVVQKSDESLRTLGLPIPAKVSDEIDIKRYLAIESVVGQLHDLLKKYSSLSYTCPTSSASSFECGSMLSGALGKELDRMTLLFPRPQVPFPKLSFGDLYNTVNSMQSPIWSECSRNSGRLNYGSPRAGKSLHGCNLRSTVVSIVADAAIAVSGLNLSEMKTSKV